MSLAWFLTTWAASPRTTTLNPEVFIQLLLKVF
jgi:hypothetical protein